MSYSEEEDRKHRAQHAAVEQPVRQDEKWMPEVGQETLLTVWKDGRWEDYPHKVRIDYRGVSNLIVTTVDTPRIVELHFLGGRVKYRPIQSQADKERDNREAIRKEIVSFWNDAGLDCPINDHKLAKRLYFAGVRIIKPGQKICTPLTDEQMTELKNLMFNSGLPLSAVIDAVQNAIFGEK